MIIKQMTTNVSADMVDTTCGLWGGDDIERRYARGLETMTMDCTFILSRDDCDLLRGQVMELIGSDVVLVKSRGTKPEHARFDGRCLYCGGNPGTRRSCEGCGAPNLRSKTGGRGI